ncbi:MAG: Mrp/NBP35 family ATP-binding protein [Brevinematia bacterium]
MVEHVSEAEFKIKNIVGIMSGKGGVGKSTITYLSAVALKLKGFRVGILDADITGSSIPELLKLKRQNIEMFGDYILPIDTQQGFRVMSMNLLLEKEDQPVVWRGPLLSKAVQQFWEEVYWGDLDFLLVDMPPGTSDVALTVTQNIPLSGLVIVTTPNSLVSKIVAKSINMAGLVHKPIWGIVENMSYIVCPACGEKIDFFGSEKTATEGTSPEIIARIPMLKELSDIPEKGILLSDENIVKILGEIGEALLKKAKLD